ncbi:MAG: N-6 DNA methylase [Phycisphaerae bacterium]|nr:N-6 DNA methylase [Phycisphaerae bacterium]
MTAGRNINSLSQTWCTPPKYVSAVRKVFEGTIALDPCSNAQSVVGAEVEYQLPDHDGIRDSWDYPTIYVNPPYGADRQRGTTIKDWLRRCARAREEYGSEVLALVPVATNTRHWKDYVFGVADAIAFLYDTRLKFLVNGEGGGKGAPMSCAMIYWGAHIERFEGVFLPFGAVVDLSRLHGKPIGMAHNGTQSLLFPNPAPKTCTPSGRRARG